MRQGQAEEGIEKEVESLGRQRFDRTALIVICLTDRDSYISHLFHSLGCYLYKNTEG